MALLKPCLQHLTAHLYIEDKTQANDKTDGNMKSDGLISVIILNNFQ